MSSDNVYRETVTVESENGLHLVPCSRIAQIANSFDCDVHVENADRRADAKTILELMTLNASKGTTLVLEARGDGAHEAISRLVQLFQARFEVADETAEL
jgi:phosphocarrier protein HPr